MTDDGWQRSYEDGKRAFEKGDFAKALELFNRVLDVKDGFADVHNMVGIIHHSSNRMEQAVESFQRALDINPRYTEALLNLAVALNEMGEYDKADSVYELAKEAASGEPGTYLDPFVKGKLANMHAELGAIYKSLGINEEAVHEYRKALSLRPDFVDIKTQLGVVFRDMKDYSRAAKLLEEAANINPRYTPARIQLGLTYYLMGERERAKAEWLKVLHEDPDHRLANMYLNLLKERQ